LRSSRYSPRRSTTMLVEPASDCGKRNVATSPTEVLRRCRLVPHVFVNLASKSRALRFFRRQVFVTTLRGSLYATVCSACGGLAGGKQTFHRQPLAHFLLHGCRAIHDHAARRVQDFNIRPIGIHFAPVLRPHPSAAPITGKICEGPGGQRRHRRGAAGGGGPYMAPGCPCAVTVACPKRPTGPPRQASRVGRGICEFSFSLG